MTMLKTLKTLKTSCMLIITLSALVYLNSVYAAVYKMCVSEFTMTMPDSTRIPMWGFALDDNNNLTDGCGNPPTAPGPEITVPTGDRKLTIRLKNELSEPVSLIIHGQKSKMRPKYFTDNAGRRRVKSFTHEALPGRVTSYTWNNFKPGSYLYQSGTHPAVQVQMGLYGLAKRNTGNKRIYPGRRYDKEITLFYSEIDPALHAAIDNNTYDTPVYPSTQNYQPKYFLINGQPYDLQSTTPINAGKVGDKLLIRFVNSGLEMNAPMFNTLYMNLIAEDGNPYPFQRRQYSVMLAPSKTKDAIVNINKAGRNVIYNRRLRTTNNDQGLGGHIAVLKFLP